LSVVMYFCWSLCRYITIHRSRDLRDIPSFPTRRSSDLIGGRKMTNTDIALEKRGTATEIQKSGVILDVVNAEQAKIAEQAGAVADRKSTRLNSSHDSSSYAVICLKKKKRKQKKHIKKIR